MALLLVLLVEDAASAEAAAADAASAAMAAAIGTGCCGSCGSATPVEEDTPLTIPWSESSSVSTPPLARRASRASWSLRLRISSASFAFLMRREEPFRLPSKELGKGTYSRIAYIYGIVR